MRASGLVLIPVGLILTIVVAVCRLLVGTTANNGISDSDSLSLNMGNGFFFDGNYELALAEFNMVIGSNPEFGEAYNSRGLVHYAMSNYDEAMADFDRTIELLPEWPAGYSNRGITYFAEGDHERAIADFDRAIQLEARFAKAYYNRGLVYSATGDFEAAIADFGHAIEFTSESSYTLTDRFTPGPARERIESQQDYMRLFQSEADLPLAYASRGVAYLNLGEFDQAAADLQKALSLGLDPDDQRWVEALLEELRRPGVSK